MKKEILTKEFVDQTEKIGTVVLNIGMSLFVIVGVIFLIGIGVYYLLGHDDDQQEMPAVPYSAPVLSPSQEWPTGFYMKGLDGDYRFYLLAEPVPKTEPVN
jgi:hypothetical protein